jgi:hypothetical protein
LRSFWLILANFNILNRLFSNLIAIFFVENAVVLYLNRAIAR